MKPCLFWLTFSVNRGSLILLFPTSRMERDPSSHSLERSNGDQRVESQRQSLLDRLRSGVRAKVLAAGLAIGGAAASSDRADAAIMRPAEVLHTADAGATITDDEVAVGWDGGQLAYHNLEDENNRDVYWIGVRSMDDTQADASLPVPGFTPEPSRIIGPNAIPGDEITSRDFIVDGQLQVRERFVLALGLVENGEYGGGAATFLEGSEIYVGYSPIHGDPTNIDEALAMTDGVVYHGQLPNSMDANIPYIVRPAAVSTPEPSTLALGGLAAGGLAVAAASRRRKRNDTRG